DAAAPTWLVLADTWFPGWRAWVDGREQPVWRANYAFRAVRLEPGSHDVVFRYQPGSLLFGLSLSAVAALICVGLVLLPPRRRRVAE
ncbi:MAG TPA: YfhO family protein, partial [Methylomirabilota bacterium]|nr:YfhO family protein [Methylomirabilota bacterium]